MAEIEAKVNMSLDDIIKLEKKKKATVAKSKRGASTARGRRGGIRGGGNMRGSMHNGLQNNIRGRSLSKNRKIVHNRNNMNNQNNMNNRNNVNNINNRRGQWKKFPQNNNVRGGFNRNRFNNGNVKSNLTRSRSNLSLNRLNVNNLNQIRGGFAARRGGGRFGLTRSRSRNNLAYPKQSFMPKNKGFLKRTTSMPDLRDPSSVHNRLGYQSPGQVAYRSRVKRAKNVLLQRQSKALKMQNAFSLSPNSNISVVNRKQGTGGRRYSAGNLHSDQMMRALKRAQYEQKLLRMSSARNNIPTSPSYVDSLNSVYGKNRHPAMALYPQSIKNQSPVVVSRQMQRGRSPFRKSLQSLKAATKAANRAASFTRQKQPNRSRSRSRSRPRNALNNNTRMSFANMMTDPGDLEDRSFSEVMYGISHSFGVTERTLNDRFSLF